VAMKLKTFLAKHRL